MQEPWLEHVGSMHWPSSTLHSAPFHPARHTHLPFSYTPFPLHSTGHESAEEYGHWLELRTQDDAHVATVHELWERSNLLWEGLRSLIRARPQIQQILKLSACFPSHTHAHSHMHVPLGLSLTVSIFSSTTWAWLPRQPRNRRKSPQTSPRSLWTGRENNRENRRLGERAFGFRKGEWKALHLCTDGELCV